jgi:hypothetical protein
VDECPFSLFGFPFIEQEPGRKPRFAVRKAETQPLIVRGLLQQEQRQHRDGRALAPFAPIAPVIGMRIASSRI